MQNLFRKSVSCGNGNEQKSFSFSFFIQNRMKTKNQNNPRPSYPFLFFLLLSMHGIFRLIFYFDLRMLHLPLSLPSRTPFRPSPRVATTLLPVDALLFLQKQNKLPKTQLNADDMGNGFW